MTRRVGAVVLTDTEAAGLRVAIAAALAGPIVAEQFGKREIHLRAGEEMPPDGTSPGLHARAREAFRDADHVLGVLVSRGIIAPDLAEVPDEQATRLPLARLVEHDARPLRHPLGEPGPMSSHPLEGVAVDIPLPPTPGGVVGFATSDAPLSPEEVRALTDARDEQIAEDARATLLPEDTDPVVADALAVRGLASPVFSSRGRVRHRLSLAGLAHHYRLRQTSTPAEGTE